MALCPICHTPGAYVGFTVVECRNPECTHFKPLPAAEACPSCDPTTHDCQFGGIDIPDANNASGNVVPGLGTGYAPPAAAGGASGNDPA